MQNFRKLDELLEKEYPADAWADDASLVASDMLEGFRPSDWEALNQTWPDRKPTWQTRLADCLAEAPAERAMGILLGILEASDEKAAKTAAISLNAFKDRIDPSGVSETQKDRIRVIAGRTPFNKMALNDLLRIIGPA